jgi:peptide/nickel transport system substrate-binding protein
MRRALLVLLLVLGGAEAAVAQAPEGQLTWAYHITIAPTWFDPADTPAIITPFTY